MEQGEGSFNALSIIHSPVFSGPHNRMTVVSELLEREGIHTTVVLPDDGQAAADRMRANGVDVVTMPLHRMRVSTDPRVHAAFARTLRSEVSALAALIEERHIDVVATNTLPNIHGPLAARKAGVACVWQIIDTYTPAPVRRLYMPLVLRLADVVMTTGIKVADAHPGTRKLGDRWVNFYPCVDIDRFTPDPAVRAAAREELGLDPKDTVIGNVSAISAMKGPDTFIRAAAELRTTHPDVRFVILGSQHPGREEYYEGLWSLARECGLVLGQDLIVHNPGRRVHELAQALDVFWMTSEPRSEGLPTAIGEAKSLGIPVVTTDVGSCSECVTDGVSGYVVGPREPYAIAAATRRILDNPDMAASMGEGGRREAEQQYASERGAEQHRIAFERAIEHRRSRPH